MAVSRSYNRRGHVEVSPLVKRQLAKIAAMEHVSQLLDQCGQDWWGTIPLELVIQEGRVVTIRNKGPERITKIAA